MLDATSSAVRVSRGLVLWVVAGVQRDKCYWPGCEGLAWVWWKRGNHLWRPCVWWKVNADEGGSAIPGSGGKQWLLNDWEYVLAFKREGWIPWADPLVMGHEPKYQRLGGEMSNRRFDGMRENLPPRSGCGLGARRKGGEKKARKRMYTRNADGSRDEEIYAPPKTVNPGNCIVVKARVGGGQMGNGICHENEAPFPEPLAEFFVRSFCPPGGIVLDPFAGSGTTLAAAVSHGRRAIGFDVRESQVDLTKRRMAGVTLPLIVDQ